MNNTQFEARMRVGELFHAARIPPDRWLVIRVDGRSFSRFTLEHFEKPFDALFHEHMIGAAHALLTELNGIYAYTESDEISILLPYHWSLFDRSHEKTVSLSAGIASASFTLLSGKAAQFDSRIWLGNNIEEVTDYFRWRQSDATRCALNNWCYWLLRQQGKSASQATATLESRSTEFKYDLLRQHDVEFATTPAWQRLGTGLFWGEFSKTGHNPITGTDVTAIRRQITHDSDLSSGNAYASFIAEHIAKFPTGVE